MVQVIGSLLYRNNITHTTTYPQKLKNQNKTFMAMGPFRDSQTPYWLSRPRLNPLLISPACMWCKFFYWIVLYQCVTDSMTGYYHNKLRAYWSTVDLYMTTTLLTQIYYIYDNSFAHPVISICGNNSAHKVIFICDNNSAM
jgi:hypothetical protein